MHEIEEQVADRHGFHTGRMQGDLPAAAEAEIGGPQQRTAGTLSVRLLAAHEHDRDAAVLSVRGEIDLETAPLLRAALEDVVEQPAGTVVVDLSDVAFMDSTGVHVLIDTLRQLTLENRRLAIACLEGGPVHRVLGVLGLLGTMRVHRSRESAVIGGDVLRPEPDAQAS